MKLIAFTGLPRSGKNTAADHLVKGHGFVAMAFATPLKDAAAVLLRRPFWQMDGQNDFDRDAILPEWEFSTRWFLQRLGTEGVRRGICDDFWVKHMRNSLQSAARTYPTSVAITDLRFPNEVDLVHEFGGLVVGISRPGTKGSDHVSDRGVDADVSIINDSGLVNLWDRIDRVVADYATLTRK